MTVRPPSSLAPKLLADPLEAALEHEIMAEKAATLGRLLARLEKALQALEACDDADERPARVDEAGEALWHVVIQRDICGFTRTERFLRDMKVPKEVRLRMGIVRGKPGTR